MSEWNLEVWLPSCGRRTARGTATRSPRTRPARSATSTATGSRRAAMPGAALASSRLPQARRRVPSRCGRRRSPARLVIALSVAAVLAVFLLYTSIAGGGTPALAPSELDGRTDKVSLGGKVVGPIRGDAHARRAPLPAPRHHRRLARAVAGRLQGLGPGPVQARPRPRASRARCGTASSSPCPARMITKCPSKYAPGKKGTQGGVEMPELGRAALVVTLGLALYARRRGRRRRLRGATAARAARRRTRCSRRSAATARRVARARSPPSLRHDFSFVYVAPTRAASCRPATRSPPSGAARRARCSSGCSS